MKKKKKELSEYILNLYRIKLPRVLKYSCRTYLIQSGETNFKLKQRTPLLGHLIPPWDKRGRGAGGGSRSGSPGAATRGRQSCALQRGGRWPLRHGGGRGLSRRRTSKPSGRSCPRASVPVRRGTRGPRAPRRGSVRDPAPATVGRSGPGPRGSGPLLQRGVAAAPWVVASAGRPGIPRGPRVPAAASRAAGARGPSGGLARAAARGTVAAASFAGFLGTPAGSLLPK